MIKRDHKYCHSPADVPKEPHFSIVEFSSIHMSDDGYGGGPTNQDTATYIAYFDEQGWKDAIHAKLNPTYGSPDKRFVALHVNVASYEIQTNVKVDIKH